MNNSNKTHWFKQLFLGLMGSVALTKAVDCFNDNISKKFFNSDFSEIIHRITTNHMPWAFIVLTSCLLFYFFLNVIRYYMAIYIYERTTADVIHGRKNLLAETKLLLKDHSEIFQKIEQECNKPEVKDIPQTFVSSIIDIFLSLFVFFLFGLAARGLTNIYAFAWISILILFVDVIHVSHKEINYFPQLKKIDSKYKAIVRTCIDNVQKENPTAYASIPYPKIREITELKTPSSKATLNSWFWIDGLEAASWGCIILLCHTCKDFFYQGQDSHKYHFYFLIPLFSLFCVYVCDLWKNKKSWGAVIGV